MQSKHHFIHNQFKIVFAAKRPNPDLKQAPSSWVKVVCWFHQIISLLLHKITVDQLQSNSEKPINSIKFKLNTSLFIIFPCILSLFFLYLLRGLLESLKKDTAQEISISFFPKGRKRKQNPRTSLLRTLQILHAAEQRNSTILCMRYKLK